MQRLGIYQKVIVLFAAILLSLAVLFGVAFGLLEGMPDWHVISSRYVTADGASFNLEAILAHPDVQQAEHMEWEGFTDAVAGITDQDLFRFAIPGADLSKAEAAEYLHGGLEDISWIATVPPQKNVQPVSGAELQARLKSINSEEVPFSGAEEGAGRLRAEWRLSGQWEGLLASLALEDVYIIEFKLNEKDKTVTAIEKRRSLTKEAGAYHLGASGERFRGITFFHLRKHKMSGLAYRDGKLEISSFDYQFNVLEMKMPLIEIVSGSGWAWAPRVFRL